MVVDVDYIFLPFFQEKMVFGGKYFLGRKVEQKSLGFNFTGKQQGTEKIDGLDYVFEGRGRRGADLFLER